MGDADCMKILLALTLLLPITAIAAPDEAVVQEMAQRTRLSPEIIRRDYDACDSGITSSMKTCGAYRWIQQDVRLSRLYARALSKAKDIGAEASLIQSQQAWLAYRDAACDYETRVGMGGEDGAYEGLYVLSCNATLTQERADRLATGLDDGSRQ